MFDVLLALLLLTLPAAVQAEDYTYTTNNGTIIITGYTGPGGAVTIPSTIDGLPVTSIKGWVFAGTWDSPNTNLTSVIIPDSVTSIEHGAFEACTSLTSVTIGNGVTSIGSWAFENCTSLTSIAIPNSVTNIGGSAFRYCTNLTAITVDALNPTYVSVDGVLFDKSQTTLIQCPGGKAGSYTVPNSVTRIGFEAFFYCTSLTNVTIANSVTTVGASAFANCTSLSSMTIPNSVTSIGGYAFENCTSLTSVTIPDSLLSIWDLTFNGCTSLANVTIPKSVTNIGPGAFGGCSSLTAIIVDALNSFYSSADGVLFDKSLTTLIQCPGGKAGNYTIPNSVTSIRSWAFENCTSLTSITIPNSVTTIGDPAFWGCTSLTNVTIGQNVNNLWYAPFAHCTNLNEITVDALNSVYSSVDGVLIDKIQRDLIKCPARKAGSYTVPNSVTTIGVWAFESCTSLTNVTIPNNVTIIVGWAFENCTSLTNVTIGNSVTNIGRGAFGGCSSLTAITVDALNPTYVSVDGVLFDKSQTTLIQCPGGKAGNYTIPNSVTSIAGYAFENCTSLTSVTIGNSITDIYGFAFSGCTNLAGVYFQGNAPILHQYNEFPHPVPTPVFAGVNATVYYLPGTTGWDLTYGGLPTALGSLTYPLILNTSPSFGVQTNGFGFIISWATNGSVVVEASTDLANRIWAPVSTNTLTGGSSYFSDPQWTNHPARFYRLRSP